jgi:hypothetical protein
VCLAVKRGKWQPKLGFVFLVLYKFQYRISLVPIPVAARCKAWDCGRTLVGIAGSNPSGGIDVCVVCCRVQVSSSGCSLVQRNSTECGVSECDLETSTIRAHY